MRPGRLIRRLGSLCVTHLRTNTYSSSAQRVLASGRLAKEPAFPATPPDSAKHTTTDEHQHEPSPSNGAHGARIGAAPGGWRVPRLRQDNRGKRRTSSSRRQGRVLSELGAAQIGNPGSKHRFIGPPLASLALTSNATCLTPDRLSRSRQRPSSRTKLQLVPKAVHACAPGGVP
jgi:hypothetical protein